MKAVGGVPVDRSSNKNLAQSLVEKFESSDEFILIITPEGTRKRVKRWKRGFYHIALAANVPIALAFIDFKTKRLGSGPILYPTGDYKADLEIIKDFYRGMEGKHPGQFSVGD